MPQPVCAAGSPTPAIVTRPSTKSVGAPGTGGGSQRSWLGGVGTLSKRLSMRPLSIIRNGSWTAAGRIRYSHVRRFAPRGAVNAVPESCSAYSPNGQRCGEFCPTGNAPGSASVANSLPKPDW
jgi:hypothetical protein